MTSPGGPWRAPTPVPACVLGDVDLVSALGRAGIPSMVVTQPGDPARYSRFTVAAMDSLDHWGQPEAYVERLLSWASVQDEKPVLYYQADGDLLLVSRYRDALARAFRFVIPAAELVEDLIDKARFLLLARRLDLKVPRSCVLTVGAPLPALDLDYPVVVKPLLRKGLFPLGFSGKAARVEDRTGLLETWQRAAAASVDVIAQQLVPGPESRVESYHAYVDVQGDVVGEFTGRKTRTYPPTFGRTTALQTTDAPDVLALGREVVGRVGLRGVVKVDFKRGPDGELWILEMNPRFSLWLHVGAAAGVNIPALVHADLTGGSRPPVDRAEPGVTWCHPWMDARAAVAARTPPLRWAREVVTADVRFGAARGDLAPFARGVAWEGLRRRAAGVVTRSR